MQYRYALLFPFFLIVIVCQGQENERLRISGVVRDARTRQPISDALISSGDSKAVSDLLGKYSISAKIGDTLFCTHLSYQKARVIVTAGRTEVDIILYDSARMLDSVTVRLSPMIPQLYFKPWKPVQFSFSNVGDSTYNNQGVVPTIGPTIVFRGLLDGLTRGARAEKKHKAVKADLERTSVYRALLEVPSTKTRLRERWTLSEERYYEILAKFNSEYPEVAYWTDETEILDFMMYYFGSDK